MNGINMQHFSQKLYFAHAKFFSPYKGLKHFVLLDPGGLGAVKEMQHINFKWESWSSDPLLKRLKKILQTNTIKCKKVETVASGRFFIK